MNVPLPSPVGSANSVISAIALPAWFGAGAWLLQLFAIYDWNEGAIRGVLLIALAAFAGIPALAVALAPARLHLAYTPLRALGIFAMICVALGFGYHVREGLRTLQTSYAQKQVWLDQGENTIRAIRLLRHGVNPYGRRTMLDPAYYTTTLEELSAKLFCAPAATSPAALQALSEHYWQDPVAHLAEMSRLFPEISDQDACRQLRRDFDSMGYKYGPLMLAIYFPFVAPLGDAGIYAANLAWFVALSLLVGVMALRIARGDLLLASLPFILLYGPVHVRWNTLTLSAVDLAPTCLALLALWSIWRAPRTGWAANAFVGLSIASKVAPGLFMLPLLGRLRPRDWGWLAIVLAALAAPFVVWDPAGYFDNNVRFIFARAPDTTSPIYYFGPIGALILKAVVLGGLAAFALLGHLRRWPEAITLAFLTLTNLGAMGLSAAFHNNYLVWVVPLLGLWMLHSAMRALGQDDRERAPKDAPQISAIRSPPRAA